MKYNSAEDENKKNTKNSSTIMLIVLLLSFNTLMFFYDGYATIVTSIISVIYVVYNFFTQSKAARTYQNDLDEIKSAVKDGANYININMPIPLIIANKSGKMLWYNDEMVSVLERSSSHTSGDIRDLIPALDFNAVVEYYEEDEDSLSDEIIAKPKNNKPSSVKQDTVIGGRYYEVLSSKYVKKNGIDSELYVLYFYDLSIYKNYEKRYQEERAAVAILEVDSYDDVMNETKESKRPLLQAEIDSLISMWASRMNALIRKYDKTKYIVVMSRLYFNNMASKRFEILDQIREIEVDSSFPPTLSIGVCVDEISYNELEREAFSALEVALGRGGDQAVVKRGVDYEFYGGKAKAVEKRNRVKARIIAHAFRPIIDESSNVYIMGHQYPDMDAFGAAIGIYKAARDRGKNAKIVLEEPNETIKMVYDTFADSAEDYFIKPKQALQEYDKESDLLVVVDTHRPSFTECPSLVELAERRVLFDHHRRGVEIIENTLLSYLEPYASSACELVTEVLQYMEKKPKLSKREAEALMAGIMLDTKNFSIKSGVRTFEAAALLKRFGADTTDVKQFMQDDMESFIARSKIVKNARRYGESMAISVSDENTKNSRLIGAQAADQMLSIRGISSSFVVVKEDNKIYISARTLKDVNVQVIMERLGGGGHLTSAGAQMTDKSVEEAEALLMESIDIYLEGEA